MKDDITKLDVAKEFKVINFRMFPKKETKQYALLITRVC